MPIRTITDIAQRNNITSAGIANGTIVAADIQNGIEGQVSTPFSFRNKIINGKMDISQRGTNFPAPGTTTYSLDRWQTITSGAGVYTVSQQSDAPPSNEFQNSLRVTVTTADTSITSGDSYEVKQQVEGYNVRDLIGRTFTLSFWVRSSKTGIHCCGFRNQSGTVDRSYVTEYTVNTANTWEYKTITVSGGLTTAGTWNWTNGSGLQVDFVLATSSALQTTPNTWQTGNFLSTANQVNCLDTVGNIFAITGVQLEAGSVATPFEHRSFGTELALCQRYYQKVTRRVTGHVDYTGTYAVFGIPLITEMRITPSLISSTTTNIASYQGASAWASNVSGTLHSAWTMDTLIRVGPFAAKTAGTLAYGEDVSCGFSAEL